jgi:hypothetical protein
LAAELVHALDRGDERLDRGERLLVGGFELLHVLGRGRGGGLCAHELAAGRSGPLLLLASGWGWRRAEQLAAVAGRGRDRVLRRAARPLLLGAPGLLLKRGGSGGVGSWASPPRTPRRARQAAPQRPDGVGSA